MKNKKITFLLILLIFTTNFSLIGINTFATVSGTLPNGAQYSWEEDTFSHEEITIWDRESYSMNYSGLYSDTYTYSYGYETWEWNSTKGDYEQYWMEVTRTCYYESNYSSYYNTTITGNSTMKTALDVFKVEVSYGENLYLIWMAAKNGTFELYYYITEMEQDYEWIDEYYHEYESEYKKYDISTYKLLDSWTESYNESGKWNYSSSESGYSFPDYSMSMEETVEFSIPMFLIMQIYTTSNDKNVAWAEMFYEYIIYNDTDKDSIYSVGENDIPATSGLSLYFSNEYRGMFLPYTISGDVCQESNYDGSSYNISLSIDYPKDKTINDLTSTIEFTAPSQGSGNTINWGIEYPDYPTYGMVTGEDYSDYYYTDFNTSYSDCPIGDYSYDFSYKIAGNNADLDFTMGLSKISDTNFYDAVQGYGLTIPHYTYFITSSKVDKTYDNPLSLPKDIFSFEIDNTKIAEINTINPLKENYTLYDYPNEGETSELSSKGATVSKMIITATELTNQMYMSGANPFMSFIFTLEDLVADDPSFDNSLNLFTIQTQNYPVWSGEKLIHDPTFTAYFTPPETITQISGYLYTPLIIIGITTIIILTVKYNKKKKIK